MKHDLRFRRTGKFRPRLLRDTPLLHSMLTAKSQPHVKGHQNRREKRRAALVEHIRQLGGNPERFGL